MNILTNKQVLMTSRWDGVEWSSKVGKMLVFYEILVELGLNFFKTYAKEKKEAC